VNVHVIVGNSGKVFSIGPDDSLPIRRAKNKAFFEMPIGTELIIKYTVRLGRNWIQAASVTGKRNRQTSLCASD
jgi:hypothetical protein